MNQQVQGLDQQSLRPQATPEQIDAMNRFMANAMMALYNEQFFPRAVEMLQKAPDAVDGMARIGGALGTRMVLQAADEGTPIEPVVILEGGRRFMEEIGDLATNTGMKVSDEDVEMAFYRAADTVRNAMLARGLVTEDQMRESADRFRSEVDMGELGSLIERIEKSKQATRDKIGRTP